MAAADPTWGLDVVSYPAADLTFTLVGGTDALVQEIRRKITTQQGALWWAPLATLDVRLWLNANLSPSTLEAYSKQIDALFEDDLRMDVVSTLTFDPDARALLIEIEVTPIGGATFTMTLDAATGALTVSKAA